MKSGLIAIDKPEGISSARVVARVKKALGAEKVGHAGTLDPFATGLLLCGINKGTRISRFFLGGHKRYLARVCLGIETDTCDLTGQTVFKTPLAMMDSITAKDVRAAVNSFTGIQDQLPPVFSALKHNGQPLYKLARKGRKIQKPPRQIEIMDLTIHHMDLPDIDMEIFCSSGTYIRTLAFDIGRKLGCGAHLSRLCRIQSSAFVLKDAVTLDTFEHLDKSGAEQRIISLSDSLSFMPGIVVNSLVEKKVKFGQRLEKKDMNIPDLKMDQYIRVMDENHELLAIVQLNENLQAYNYCCVFSS